MKPCLVCDANWQPDCVHAPTDQPPIRVIGIFDPKPCEGDKAAKEHGIQHVGGVVTEDEIEISADDAIALIDAGRVLDMIPPPGAPAHAAHVATGFSLLLQVRTCELCGKRVLFA